MVQSGCQVVAEQSEMAYECYGILACDIQEAQRKSKPTKPRSLYDDMIRPKYHRYTHHHTSGRASYKSCQKYLK